MPITYHLRSVERSVIIVHEGVVNDNEFLAFYKALYEDKRIDKSFNLLVDLQRTKSSERGGAALRELAQFIQGLFKNVQKKPKVAVVAPKDVSFGMARMYSFFSSEVPWEFNIFRSIDNALDWLGLSEDLLQELN